MTVGPILKTYSYALLTVYAMNRKEIRIEKMLPHHVLMEFSPSKFSVIGVLKTSQDKKRCSSVLVQEDRCFLD